jgi:hypothetical protein
MSVDSPKVQITGGGAAYLVNALRTTRSTLFTPGLNGRDFSEIGREIVGRERFDVHFD